MAPKLVLASASPARLATLRAAGFDPTVLVSQVDEAAVLSQALAQRPDLHPSAQVLTLAEAKAVAVQPLAGPALVLGCDSMLALDGQVLGKPASPAEAFARIKQQAGREATLYTGHFLINNHQDLGDRLAKIGATAQATVRFGEMSDQEIRAYVQTGEPLGVAGAFTIDQLGGPFIESIDGDPHAVVGLSLPLFRHLLDQLGFLVMDLWRPQLLKDNQK